MSAPLCQGLCRWSPWAACPTRLHWSRSNPPLHPAISSHWKNAHHPHTAAYDCLWQHTFICCFYDLVVWYDYGLFFSFFFLINTQFLNPFCSLASQPCHPICSSWSRSFLQPSTASWVQTAQGGYIQRCELPRLPKKKFSSKSVTAAGWTKSFFWISCTEIKNESFLFPWCWRLYLLAFLNKSNLTLVRHKATQTGISRAIRSAWIMSGKLPR